ncbi:hypothetical protein V8J88_23105 [Massilia sp. W12]|uniref:hypothetical protein n=1 Tax=Massilia sp. W12 TaxID=3126507 RepID=UPI0030D09E5B
MAEPPTFIPHKLLDTLIEEMGLRNDAELSRALGVPPPVISQIRHRKLGVGATMLLRMHEESNVSIAILKDLLKASEKLEAPIPRRPQNRKGHEEDDTPPPAVNGAAEGQRDSL